MKIDRLRLLHYGKNIIVMGAVIGIGTVMYIPFILPETKGEWNYVILTNGKYVKTIDIDKATHRHIRLYRRNVLYREYYEFFNRTLESNDLSDFKVESEKG